MLRNAALPLAMTAALACSLAPQAASAAEPSAPTTQGSALSSREVRQIEARIKAIDQLLTTRARSRRMRYTNAAAMSSTQFWIQQDALSRNRASAVSVPKFPALSAGDLAPAGEPRQGRSVFEARRLQAERSALVARLAQQAQP